jgi:hypothetical protein
VMWLALAFFVLASAIGFTWAGVSIWRSIRKERVARGFEVLPAEPREEGK